MADEPIIRIDIDDEQLRDVERRLDELRSRREKLQVGPGAQQRERDNGWRMGRGARDEPREFARESTNPKFTGPHSFIGLFARDSVKAERSWRQIERHVHKARHDFDEIGRSGFVAAASRVFGGIGGLGSAGLSAALAAFFGVRGAASGIAGQAAQARNLGLAPGKADAFKAAFARFGAGEQDLESLSNIQQDISRQAPLYSLGLSQERIAGDDAEQLWYDAAKRAGSLYADWEKQGPAFALTQSKAYGLTDLFSPDQLRNLASYVNGGGNELDQAQQQYEQNWRAAGASQEQGKAAADFLARQDANWNKISAAWNRAVIVLAPAMDRWSDAATGLTTKFLDRFASTVADLDNQAAHPGTQPTTRVGQGAAEVGHRLRAASQQLRDWISGKPGQLPSAQSGAGAGAGASLDDVLDTIQKLEDPSGDPNAASAAGAVGPYQLMPATAAQYGADPRDPVRARAAARKLLVHDLRRFNGDLSKALAAYNWGEGNAARDVAKYGVNWRQHLPDETKAYLANAQKLGLDFDNPLNQSAGAGALRSGESPAVPGGPLQSYAPPSASTSMPAALAGPNNQLPADGGWSIGSVLDKLGSYLREGGGAQWRSPDAQTVNVRTAVTTQPVQVVVKNLTGADVSVTGQSLAAGQ